MRRLAPTSLLAALIALWGAAPARAQDPLALVPPDAEFVVALNKPHEFAAALYQHNALKDVLALEPVKAYYDSTNVRRAQQLLGFFEKKLERSGKEMLEQLSSGGVVLTGRITKNPGLLLIVQGRDGELWQRFAQLAVDTLNKEFERQEIKDRIKQGEYRGFKGGSHKAFRYAIAGSALVLSTDKELLQATLDRLADKKTTAEGRPQQGLKDALAALPKNCQLVGWLDFATIREQQGFKDGFEAVRLNPLFQITSGALLDVLHRTSAIYVGLAREGQDFRLRVAMPAGRQGMSATGKVFVPEDQQGTLPPLQPPRCLASSTEHLDFAQLWSKRKEIFNEEGLRGIEELEKNAGIFLFGNKFSNLMEQAGRHYRLVAAGQDKSPYQIKPATPVPAFALVLEMRDQRFGKTMNSLLRSAALLGGFQVGGLKMKEEDYKGQRIVAYYFDEKGKLDGDTDNLRFNFSPCFATVGEHFVVSSTVELGRDLVDVLAKEKKPVLSKASSRTFVYASGFASAIKGVEDDVLTQTILSQGLPPAEARKQVALVTKIVESLGSLSVEFAYEPREFRFDLLWRYGMDINCCED